MSFYRKIFLSLFLTSSLLLLAALGVAHRSLRATVTKNYQIRYQSQAKTLADTVEKLESGTEDSMHAALQAIRYYTTNHPVPSTETLRALQQDLRLSSIEFVRSDGKFIRSTKYKLSELPSLFKFCAGYQKLFTGESQYDHTPLMPSVVDQHVQKFALLPTTDHQYVINVGIEVDYIADIFRSSMASDRNIMRLAIYTPSGKSLASFIRNGDSVAVDTHPASIEAGLPTRMTVSRDSIGFTTRVKSTNDVCCECVGKGLVTDSSGTFYYVLKTQVSLGDLNDSLANIRWMLAILGGLGLGTAYFLSRIIARKLTLRIDLLTHQVKKLRDSQDLRLRLNMAGSDEIAEMGNYFDSMLQKLQESQQALLDAEKERVLGRVSSQVAHDVKSPLAALEMVLSDLHSLPENKRILVRNAINRIKDIVNNLLSKTREILLAKSTGTEVSGELTGELATKDLLSGLIETIVSEKRQQFRDQTGINIDTELGGAAYGLFCNVQAVEFKRVLSNLINNAVEAIQVSGVVIVSVQELHGRIVVSVRDNGKGIPAELIPRLGTRGATHEKNGGLGLGLFHAKTCIEAWGGILEIQSAVAVGTTVFIKLPKVAPPDWFVPELTPKMNVIVLDDDRSIHDLWMRRFEEVEGQQTGVRVWCFSNPQDMISWLQGQNADMPAGNFLFLIDYEFMGRSETGLDVIERLHLCEQSILVSSRFEESEVRRRCELLKIRVIPKALVTFVPIRILSTNVKEICPRLDAVLIDNDSLVRDTWKILAEKNGKAVLVYSGAEALLANIDSIDRTTPIYIDFNLENEQMCGIAVAEELHRRGFRELFLSTGVDPDELPRSDKIKGVRGKEPPWV